MMGAPFILVAAAVLSGARACPSAKGYIYDQVGTNIAQVFNVQDGTLSQQSQSSADVRRSTELGGPFRICSSRSFYCLASSSMTAYNMIVPKSEAAGKWSLHGITCTTATPVVGQMKGTCQLLGFVTSYVYERGRGLTSYSIVDGDREYAYRVRGRCGLFSRS